MSAKRSASASSRRQARAASGDDRATPGAPRRSGKGRPGKRRSGKRSGAGSGGAWLLGLLAVSLVLSLWALPERFRNRVRSWIPGQVERIIVVEGADVFQVATLLESRRICGAAAFREAVRDRVLLLKFGIDAPSAEGYLAPASYEFFHDSLAVDVLQKMLSVRQRELAKLLGHTLPLPLSSLHEVIILGSLVEREAQRDDERPKIARAFLNRLVDLGGETRGRLQSDPAAAYGCLAQSPPPPGCEGIDPARSARAVTSAMLRSDANLYNTYRSAGLPPGPICNPGQKALLAAVQPAAGDVLYFVADGRGGHRFSSTYAEHRRIVHEQPDAARQPGDAAR